ncbi:transglutaminase-like domain-containing protein [Brachybacterium sp. AOP43-C2-M15]|uniref:transglutaminase-like domain-containing protein n=1 Tax=Brachybacterium sp. AOP43-C2-M15 TaxID=3457661 RepID=UPI0040334F5B
MAMTLSTPPVPADWTRHTPFSDPGRHAELLEDVAPSPEAIGPVVRNLLAHYRAEGVNMPVSSRDDINLRWVEEMLSVDQERHPGRSLQDPRATEARLQGCCRDHTLLSVSILRGQGIPARSRVGFADYFVPGWHSDHVVAELHDGERWRRFDPEVAPESGLLPDPWDLEVGPGAPFTTAAEAYRALRAGELDAASYGVAPDHELSGDAFVLTEVFWELAHRYGDELLLWDGWGAIPAPEEEMSEDLLALLDEVAEQLIAADAGDKDAEQALHALYVRDDRLHPGERVLRFSPLGDGPVAVDLRRGEDAVTRPGIP